MAAARGEAKAQSRKGKGGKETKAAGGKVSGRKKGGSRWPAILAVALPLTAVGGFLAYNASPAFSNLVDGTFGKVRDMVGGGAPRLPPADSQAGGTGGEEVARLPLSAPPADVPRDRPKPYIPRQAPKAAVAATTSLSVKTAQALVRHVFGGSVTESVSAPGSSWYTVALDGAKSRAPYAAVPGKVSMSNTALHGRFVKGTDGFVVTLKVEDPAGPEWASTFVGSALIAGTPAKPGKVLGLTALQAPHGAATRCEAMDLQSDGVLELLLEVESEAPGGYLFRDLAIHSFTQGGTRLLFETRTLDDGPGVPTESARFRNVSVRDLDADGVLEIVVEEGVRNYTVAKDFSRKLKSEKITATKTWRRNGARYRVAAK